MRGLTRTGLIVAVVTTLVVAIAWFATFGASFGAVSSIDSNSMSHGPDELDGVLDPGEWRRLEPIDEAEDVRSFYQARGIGHGVGGDHGDVIAYRPDGTEGSSTMPRIVPWSPGEGSAAIEHRAIAWVLYNASADAYDVPALGIHGERSFTLPGVGTYDRSQQAYVHRDLDVHLDPELAGRHDGFLTKGDNNELVDQDERGGLAQHGHVELVPTQRIEGKIADHVDTSTIRAFQLGVPVAAALFAAGTYAWRGGHLDAFLSEPTEDEGCPGCGRTVDDEAPFCPSCGAER